MSARNTNNRRYWPRSAIMYPPMAIILPNDRPVSVLTTAAVSTVTPITHEYQKIVTTLIITRTAVRAIQ